MTKGAKSDEAKAAKGPGAKGPPKVVRYFRRGKERVYLQPCDRAFSLAGVGLEATDFFACVQTSGLEVVAKDAVSGVVIVELPKGNGNSAVALRRAMRAKGLSEESVRIGPAYRLVDQPEGAIWAPTGCVTVCFMAASDREAIDALFKRRGLRIRSPTYEGSKRFLVAVEEGDPIEMARKLVEQEGALFAEPEFLRTLSVDTERKGARGAPGPTPTEDWEVREAIEELHGVLDALGGTDEEARKLTRALVGMQPESKQPSNRWARSVEPFAPDAAGEATIREALAYARNAIDRIEEDLLVRQGRSTEAQIEALRRAVRLVETEYPLPRCDHGHALLDHGGDTLEPSCGCRLISVDGEETSWIKLDGNVCTTGRDGHRKKGPAGAEG